ncbi:M16 family metallopeptidase [Sphingobacterium faecale]|uniref:Insulinase family protein n=1 Tax=Sphingobacterium faecale TaxID=2803775 RepID=A0ABS1R3L8_9SPHI|nr:pitrilysin family protein [Sphingobacterium faecale]MBL1409309.1 insulinase family protein [Sphingobacterium faecale]
MPNRLEAPPYQAIGDLELVQPDAVNHSNGLRTFLFHSEELELMKFEFIFENHYEKSELPILNVALSSMLKEGTTTRNSAEIAEEIDFYGAYLMPEYSFDYTALSLYTTRKHVDKVLPIIADVLMNSTFPEEELETYIRNNKQSLQIALQKNDVVARRLFYKNLFGTNQYGAVADLEDYDTLSRAKLYSLFEQQIRSNNCTLMIAGRVDQELQDLVDSLFGQEWAESKTAVGNAIDLPLRSDGQLVVEPKEEALQSAIRMGGITEGRAHPDFPALQFVNTLLGGFFGSRLMRNIREDKGYTYGIGSAVVSLKHTAFMTLGSEAGADVTNATLVEIEKEFKRLREELTTIEEVDLVRNYMQGNLLGSLESIFSHVDKFKAVYFSGLDLSYYHYYHEVLRTMTPERVQEIAVRYFDFDKLTKVIVGKY